MLTRTVKSRRARAASRRTSRPKGGRPRVLILIENLPLDKDARVRRQCRALLDAGYDVSVICPRGDDERTAEELPDVRLHTFAAPAEGRTAAGYLREYLHAWFATAWLTLTTATREGFDAIQACNPPDLFFPLAVPFKLAGKRFVFDHHDLCPELYTARSGSTGALRSILEFLERLTLRTADHVIATNASVRDVAFRRGGRTPEDVTVVRNGPELSSRPRPSADRRGHDHDGHLVCWVGVMGVDDGVDLALEAIAHLVHKRGRADTRFVLLGDGEERPALMDYARSLGIDSWVSFPGWVDEECLDDTLRRADIGLAPDPPGPRADRATMMKVMDYMAAGIPVVAFDVAETRISAGPAGVYVDDGDPVKYAAAIDQLLHDPQQRRAMGQIGRERIERELAWDHQRDAYVGVYNRLLQTRVA